MTLPRAVIVVSPWLVVPAVGQLPLAGLDAEINVGDDFPRLLSSPGVTMRGDLHGFIPKVGLLIDSPQAGVTPLPCQTRRIGDASECSFHPDSRAPSCNARSPCLGVVCRHVWPCVCRNALFFSLTGVADVTSPKRVLLQILGPHVDPHQRAENHHLDLKHCRSHGWQILHPPAVVGFLPIGHSRPAHCGKPILADRLVLRLRLWHGVLRVVKSVRQAHSPA